MKVLSLYGTRNIVFIAFSLCQKTIVLQALHTQLSLFHFPIYLNVFSNKNYFLEKSLLFPSFK
ncbi:rCG31604 [Rattus norvegicus]|uniref:RCG31604 n=1 Tax=Rattus norvegicus TaxID=10116 RepID=A6JNH2_RAT|nr:rCG31604 [Rattus norvegicus]